MSSMPVQHACGEEMSSGHPVSLGPPAASRSQPSDAATGSWCSALSERARRASGFLLRLPLFYKIVLANTVIIVGAVLAGYMLSADSLPAQTSYSTEAIFLLALAGIALIIFVNVVMVRFMLSPLRTLEQTASRIQDGDLSARAALSVLADRDLVRLAGALNGVLESLALTQERLRDIAGRALGATEEERKRIARELHDDTAQRLAVLLIRLRILQGEKSPEARDKLLEEVRSEISSALEGVRRFAHGLRPPALDEMGLLPAVESYVQSWAETVRVPVDLQIADMEDQLSSEAELAVYRIIQEALSNTARHARARRASVRIQRRGGRISVVVQDYGQGFSVPEVLRSGRGLGLFGMEERSAYVGGSIRIESEPGRGTRIEALIPVRHRSASTATT